MVNFYEVLRSPRLRRRLYAELGRTPYARKLFLRSIDIFFSPRGYSRVRRAWALFTACAQAYNTKISESWSLSATTNRAERWQRKIELLKNPELERLLQHLQLDKSRCTCADPRPQSPTALSMPIHLTRMQIRGITAATATRTSSYYSKNSKRRRLSLCYLPIPLSCSAFTSSATDGRCARSYAHSMRVQDASTADASRRPKYSPRTISLM